MQKTDLVHPFRIPFRIAPEIIVHVKNIICSITAIVVNGQTILKPISMPFLNYCRAKHTKTI